MLLDNIHFKGCDEGDYDHEMSSDLGRGNSVDGDDVRNTNPTTLAVSKYRESMESNISSQSIQPNDLVYKIGATTGFTTGTLYGMLKAAGGFNNGKPVFAIQWSYEDPFFAANGDCGAVYFCVKGGHNIPFAVHVGSARMTIEGETASVSLGAPLLGESLGFKELDFGDYNLRFKTERNKNLIDFDICSDRDHI